MARIEIPVNKNDLINMIVGRGCFDFSPFGKISGYDHLIKECGNQHNPDWKFDVDKLRNMSRKDLFELYRNGNEFKED